MGEDTLPSFYHSTYHASPAPLPQLSLAGIGADKGQLSSVFSPSTETEKQRKGWAKFLVAFLSFPSLWGWLRNKKHKGWKCGSLVHISLLVPRLNCPEIIWFSPFLPASFVWMYIYGTYCYFFSHQLYFIYTVFFLYTLNSPAGNLKKCILWKLWLKPQNLSVPEKDDITLQNIKGAQAWDIR